MHVGKPSKQPATNRPHEEPSSENAGRREQLARSIAGREKGAREINRRIGVAKEVEPLNEITGTRADDAPYSIAMIQGALDSEFLDSA